MVPKTILLLPSEIIDNVYQYALNGMSENSIRRMLNLSLAEFAAQKKANPELMQSINKGWANHELNCIGVMMQALTDDSIKVRTDAAKFFLTRRHNWAENVNLTLNEEAEDQLSLSDEDVLKLLGQASNPSTNE